MTIEELKERLAEIDAELAEIVNALDAPAEEEEPAEEEAPAEEDRANIEQMETRSAELLEERARIAAEIETAEKAIADEKRKANEVANGRIEIREKMEEVKAMTNAEIRKSAEYVNAYANYIKSGDDAECRALLTENVGSGTVPVPELVYDIVQTAWNKEGIMSRVKKAYIKGNLKVGFEISADAAVVHTEGASAPSEESLVLGTVSIVPQSIKKWITISDEVLDMSAPSFLQYVYDEVAYQIAKKAADTLVGQIIAATTASTATAVGVPAVTIKTAGMDTVAQALAQLSDEAANPTIMMNKSTWAAFKGIQYANGYAADPFEGLDVVFNNTITAYSAATTGVPYMLVGDLDGAIANFPNGEEITFKYDDLSLAESDLVKIVGREFVGLGIVKPGAFVKVTK